MNNIDFTELRQLRQNGADDTNKPLQPKAIRRQQDIERAKVAYKEHQDNIRKAGTLRSEILKGTADEELSELFLKACECIAVMTEDSTYLDNIQKALQLRKQQTNKNQ